MYNGYTYAPTTKQKIQNELAALRGICAMQPDNTYWQNRLIAAEAVAEAAEIEAWLGCANDGDIQQLDGQPTGISKDIIF